MKQKNWVLAGVCAALVGASAGAGAQSAASNNAANRNDRAASSASAMQGSSSASATSQQPNAKGEPTLSTILVLVPVQQATDNKLGNGCWVRFYDAKNYRGANLTLVGPVDMPRMEVPGAVWHNWDSAIVGPKAKVVAYDNENYRDRDATLNAGQHIADLGDKKLGWFDQIRSVRVSCAS